jgi:hypothetical protein
MVEADFYYFGIVFAFPLLVYGDGFRNPQPPSDVGEADHLPAWSWSLGKNT